MVAYVCGVWKDILNEKEKEKAGTLLDWIALVFFSD